MKRTLLLAGLMLCGIQVAPADTIQTKTGETIKGRVLEETKQHVKIRTAYGELTLPRPAIRRHTRPTYVVELKDGKKLEGQIVAETAKNLSLKSGGKTQAVALAQVKHVREKKTSRATKPPGPRKLNPAQALAIHRRAMAYFNKKDYAKSVTEYQKILASNPENMLALYNTACAHALMKNKPKALEFLRKAIEAGYVNFSHMEQDGDLDNIRKEPDYLALMKDKDTYVKKSTEKAVARITRSMKQRGVDIKKYRPLLDEKRNFLFLHTKTDPELAAIRNDLNRYAEHQWKHLFQNKPTRPLYIVLLAPGDSRKIFRGRAGGVYNSGANALFCGDIPTFKLMKTSVVVHEFTHALHYADMGARKQRHPIWLIEGLATLFEASDRNGDVIPRHSYRLAVVQAAVRLGRHLPWKTLMKLSHPQFMRAARLTYAQSRYMLFYMHEKGLLKKFYDEYTNKANYNSDKTALESFEVVFGKPIESVERDWRQWVLKQTVPPIPFLGIRTQQKGPSLVVVQVSRGTPAAKAGIQNGDTIAAIDGEPIPSTSALMDAVGRRKVGDQITVEVARKGKKLPLKVKLGKRPGLVGPTLPKTAPYLGLAVEEKNGALVVKEVAPGSPAAKVGIRAGTVLVEFSGKKVSTVRAYLATLKKLRPGRPVKIKIRKGKEIQEVAPRLAAQPTK